MKFFIYIFLSVFLSIHSFADSSRNLVGSYLTQFGGTPISIPYSGAFSVSNGGTGLSSLTSGSVLVGAGTSSPTLVAPGASGNVLTSNGSTWVSSPAGSAGALESIKTWTLQASANLTYNNLFYDNSLFVGTFSTLSTNAIITSPDGITWTQRTTPNIAGIFVAAYGGGTWVAMGTSSAGANTPLYSTDNAVTWTAAANIGNKDISSVAFGAGLFVAVGVDKSAGTSTLLTSPDGITWTSRTDPSPSNNSNSVAFGGGVFVIAGNSGKILTSPDGINWTSRTYPSTDALTGVIYVGTNFYLRTTTSGTGRRISYSTNNGVTWTMIPNIASSTSTNGLKYGNGFFFQIPNVADDPISYSYDGITWMTGPPIGFIPSICAFGNNAFVCSSAASNTYGRFFRSGTF